MSFSPSTVELLAALDVVSSGRLTRRDDLGFLYETAEKAGLMGEFDELCFHAKFAHRTYGIMQRIGKDAQGYGNLQREFTVALQRCNSLARGILEFAPPAAGEEFATRYLVLASDTLRDFLALCYDLSWYKNWHIDRRGNQNPPESGNSRS